MMTVINVDVLADDVFSIVVGDGNETCQSLCKFSIKEGAGDSKIRAMNFESPEFNTLMMKGEIDFREVRQAIKDAAGKAR